MILAVLLFAAHILRLHGIFAALLVVVMPFTLFIRRNWVLYLWQILTGLAIIEWLRMTFQLLRMRLILELPFGRLMIIMTAVILFNGFVLFWLRNKKLQDFYR